MSAHVSVALARQKLWSDYDAACLRGSLCSSRLKAFPTKNGAALRRAKWNCRLLSASRTSGLRLYFCISVTLPGHGGRAQHSDPLGFASLAALGLILELLVVKEKLFPGRENEVTSTVHAL